MWHISILRILSRAKNEWETNILFCPRRLTMRSICSKAINNIHYLSSFYYYRIFPNRQHGIIIITLVVPKICFLSGLNRWRNLLDPVKKRQLVMRMKVNSNKGICSEFGSNFWMAVDMIIMSCHWLIRPLTFLITNCLFFDRIKKIAPSVKTGEKTYFWNY